jgi:hypothetical protein
MAALAFAPLSESAVTQRLAVYDAAYPELAVHRTHVGLQDPPLRAAAARLGVRL